MNLLTLPRLARELRLPKDWLREQADAGVIPCLRVSKNRRLFNLVAVQDALAAKAANPHGGVGEGNDASE